MLSDCGIKFTLTRKALCDKRDLKQTTTATATRTRKNERYNGRQFKLNMESCEPADEEELPSFSLGMEFLTPQKERKKKKQNKKKARPVSSRFANHRVENVIKQLVHTSAVRSSRYEARGKFREHERCKRVARGVAESYSSVFSYASFVLSKLHACFISR